MAGAGPAALCGAALVASFFLYYGSPEAGGSFVGLPEARRRPRGCRGLRAQGPRAGVVETAEKTAIQPLSWVEKPKTPTLPANIFKPKQSLSQNFLADPNYVFKMVSAVDDESPGGKRVLELGPGTGALTSRLHPRYPDMFAIELDQRAMRVLAQNVPGTTVVRSDVLLVNYTKLAEIRGGPLTVIGNLPYHVTSQVLFTLADHASSVRSASVTMQKEVAERIVARPNSKKYGILSVAFQLYADAKILFSIPPTAFFPRPNVMSSFVKLDFESAKERRLALNIDPRDLRNLTNRAFNQRRKMLQNSLKRILECHTTLIDELPEEYAKLRPEQIEPWEFVHLTQLIFGKKEFPKHLRLAWRGEFGRTVRSVGE
mmetsp:Transcript_85519/g.191159  ORF Transcript_85519/g.191159 Transcript_85519/m.191159 type:complete len:372 (-) Transcript_85519:107-1222(-)